MDYTEFLKQLEALYRRYFNETDGVRSTFDEARATARGCITDKLSIRMPSGLEGYAEATVYSSIRDFDQYGVYAPVKVDARFYVHRKGQTVFTRGEVVHDQWKSTLKPASMLKKYDGLFKEMLKLLRSTTNSKTASIDLIADKAVKELKGAIR